ncbi:SlyX family protein [Celerinatantimonas sp. YJH-8]|uniref:SlyX family protein n=1 Tax=Celerinatantimonas sp. YJH-8 TaxID=3228714 RepID=UPI0038C5A9F6
MPSKLEQRIEQLEMQIAFQDDTIEQLNQALTDQQWQLDKMTRQLQLLGDKFKEFQPSPIASQAEETPPPHY